VRRIPPYGMGIRLVIRLRCRTTIDGCSKFHSRSVPFMTGLLQSESTSEAIWNSKWYQADARLRKDILFLLTRSHRKFFITVGSFGILSLDLFVKVIL
jgi:hypothetical protein